MAPSVLISSSLLHGPSAPDLLGLGFAMIRVLVSQCQDLLPDHKVSHFDLYCVGSIMG